MPNCIARIFEPLLRLLLPAPGRHRAPAGRRLVLSAGAPGERRSPVPAPLPPGEGVALVRPYVLTPAERREQRLQRARRRVLWLAVHGFDAGPRWIHGVEVVG
ncbi:hypothetical protein AB0C96_10275 [Streptomyces sp. NPDC048506]|uniref:hypothetical protein n=1 Tax=Streptomyces sp. NPDC048506 TaxID=3155028 RepID=UPI0034261399